MNFNLKLFVFSVEIIIKEECCVGQSITLQLMKRARNSLQAYPISELRQNACIPSHNTPLSVGESNFSVAYSRILNGDKKQASHSISKKYINGFTNLIFYVTGFKHIE